MSEELEATERFTAEIDYDSIAAWSGQLAITSR
jgi:hypothetical protein